jgi:hypothetical protein
MWMKLLLTVLLVEARVLLVMVLLRMMTILYILPSDKDFVILFGYSAQWADSAMMHCFFGDVVRWCAVAVKGVLIGSGAV